MIHEKTNTLTIKTPEGIEFALKLAGPVTRFMAWVIDFFCILVSSNILSQVVMIFGFVSPDIAMAFRILILFIISIGYGIVLEWYWKGQTIGKRLMRLRVMDVQGLRLQFSQIAIRNLLRFVDSLPLFYLFGGIVCLISEKSQRLGDLAANTIVVRTPPFFEPGLDNILSDKYNSFHAYPHLEARLRQRISPEEANIAIQALLRRDRLDPVARINLFRDIAASFRAVVEFPQEATEGISDEQYVRNVVDALFQRRIKPLAPTQTSSFTFE
jgi:uncharacterized RDD family membrane protein YckC